MLPGIHWGRSGRSHGPCRDREFSHSRDFPPRGLGRLIFHAGAPLGAEDRDEIGRTLTTVARLVSTALEIEQLSRR